MSPVPLDKIVEELDADSAAIMMPNKAEGHLFCCASYNMPPEWVAIKNSFDEKIPGGNVEVFKTGEPATTNHLQKMLEGFFIESVMIVPIYRGNDLIATLELIHDKDDKVFTEADQQVAEAFVKEIEPELEVKSF